MSVVGLGKRRSRNYYWTWRAVFVFLVLLFLSGLYYATQQVDYVWRWYRVPQYFVTQATEEIRSMIPGEVVAVERKDETLVVTVGNQDEEESHVIPKEGGELRVSKGDMIFSGDVLGTHTHWKVGILMEGLWITLKVSFLAIIAGILLGLFTGLARLSDNPTLKYSAITYIELIRGSPLLVQIFIWYFVFATLINKLLSQAGLPQIPPLWFGVASLATFAGAYVAEIVRAGVQSISRGQIEAAHSLGMNGFQAMRHIVLPQAFKRILPPLAGQFISLIKDSSLLGIIAIRELTKATREVVSSSLMPFELWFLCAVLYLVLTFTLSMVLQWMERRMVGS
jgi:polar amino acid transport system permease protein